MDHAELIMEMQHIEKLTTQERLRLAHKRRMQQLKRWSQREKEWTSKRNKMLQNEQKKRQQGSKDGNGNVHFISSVMLLEAAGRNDIEEVRRLLMQGVSPDSTNEDGLTALHQCCIDDNEDMMKLLLEFKANVNAEDSEKWTPLHAAATCGHLHLVKYLISRDANLLAVNADGNMPYDICEDDATLDYIESEMAKRGVTQDLIEDTRAAVETRMLEDLKELVRVGGELECRDEQGATPLHVASANGYIQVVEFLLDNHVSTDVRDDDYWQPIHAAACWGHPDVLELLVQNGADLNAKTRNNETPQDICEDPELRERIIQLRSEQETKRLQDAQKKKIRRSQSSNTRTQSIRRTSYREKNMTSKKEAVEEAKIRIQLEQEYDTPGSIPQDNRQAEDGNDVGDLDEDVDVAMLLQLRRDTHGEVRLNPSDKDRLLVLEKEGRLFGDNEKCKRDVEHEKERPAPLEPHVEKTKGESGDRSVPDGGSLGTGGAAESGNKIDIHVSVTISTTGSGSGGGGGGFLPSPGTLADLKKQRSLSRTNLQQQQQQSSSQPNINNNNNSYAFSSSSSSPAAGEGLQGSSAASNGRQADARHKALVIYDPSASPTPSLRRFAQPEVIGPPEKQGCCLIM